MNVYSGTMNAYQYADYYVSTRGNDLWSGRLAEPNEENTDGPFATISRARDAVRLMKRDTYRNIYVLLRGGEYIVTEPVIFEPQDSHYDSYKIIYAAYPGEVPVFSSDVELEGWKLAEEEEELPIEARGHVYVASYEELELKNQRMYTLYENGVLLTRAKSNGLEPREEIPCSDGGVNVNTVIQSNRKTLLYPEDSIRNWDNLEDIEIFIQPNVGYVTNYLPLASVDEKNKVAYTAITSTYPMGKVDKHLHAMGEGSFRVENALMYLTQPGEWVVNSKKKKVYYWPIDIKPKKVTFPRLTTYIQLDGHEKGGQVKNISFEGITFTRGEREVVIESDIALQHEWDMWNKSNTMLRLRDASYCSIIACRFCNSGAGAIRVDLASECNVITNNLIDYIGGTGILLCGYGPGHWNVNRCNQILNNHIHHCGERYYQSNGIMVYQSSNNVVKHNLLHHLPYDSIVLSGVRPSFFNAKYPVREMAGTIRREEIAADAQYQEVNSRDEIHAQWKKVAPYYQTRDNLVEENEIFCTMLKMFDGNAIYLSDVGSGNIIRRNYIHHLNGVGMQQGIRTDAFIKDTLITENIVYNCTGGGINTKYYENNVVNNIIADIRDIVFENSQGETKRMFIGYVSLLEVYKKEEMPPNTELRVQRNIFYKTKKHHPFYRETMVNGKLEEVNLEEVNIDYNLYYDQEAGDQGESRVDCYKNRGVDAHSIVGDPLFTDIKKGDFSLKSNSKAFALGFKNITMSNIGLTSQYPADYEKIVIEQLGADYKDFDRLERLCQEKGSEKLQLEILDNV